MLHTGKILKRYFISPSVVQLDLEVLSLLTFQPGQWVDFMVPPNDWVGGFSIASSPHDLPRMTLAVKASSDRPARWVHEESSEGQQVQLKVGGTCVLEQDSTRPSIFCAGGIGISPILSQYREFLRQRQDQTSSFSGLDSDDKPSAQFLYSAATIDDFVFAKELIELSQKGCCEGKDRMIFTMTQNPSNESCDEGRKWIVEGESLPSYVERRQGRILKEFLDSASMADANYYLCGPPSMIDDAVEHLELRGVPTERLKYEKWW